MKKQNLQEPKRLKKQIKDALQNTLRTPPRRPASPGQASHRLPEETLLAQTAFE
jgi:hypothetical protein